MAADWDESSLDLSDFDPSAVIRIQALCRGWLTRKELQGAQSDFLQIITEIDGPSVAVTWTDSSLPRPVVCKASKQSKTNRQQAAVPVKQQGPGKVTHNLACTSQQASERRTQTSKAETVSTQTHQEEQTASDTAKILEQAQEEQKSVSNRVHDHDAATGSVHGDEVVDHPAQDCQHGGGLNSGAERESQENSHADLDRSRDSRCSRTGVDTSDQRERECPTKLDMGNTAEQMKAEERFGNCKNSNTGFPAAADSSTPTSTCQKPSPDPTPSSSWIPSQKGRMRVTDSFHGDQTSVWDSSSSVVQDYETAYKKFHGQQSDHHLSDMKPQGSACTEEEDSNTLTALRSLSTEELMHQRQSVAMELLWVQQAIISRKQYLKLKTQMDVAT